MYLLKDTPKKIAKQGDVQLSCRLEPRSDKAISHNTSVALVVVWQLFDPCGEIEPKFFATTSSRSIEPVISGNGKQVLHSNPSLKGSLKTLNSTCPHCPNNTALSPRIEELFSELDKGIESLKTARAQLKVYRQAVLKHAFEGKLTAQWREENKDKLEKPGQLLARIKQERETRYERQTQGMEGRCQGMGSEVGKSGRKATFETQEAARYG